MELRQKREQTIRQLGLEVERLYNLAHPKLDKHTRETFEVTTFTSALADLELRKELFKAKPVTLVEAMTMAERFEAAGRQANMTQSKRSYQISAIESDDPLKTKENIWEKNQASNQHEYRPIENNAGSSTTHFVTQCPQQASEAPPPPRHFRKSQATYGRRRNSQESYVRSRGEPYVPQTLLDQAYYPNAKSHDKQYRSPTMFNRSYEGNAYAKGGKGDSSRN
jgi:hypothetical protein